MDRLLIFVLLFAQAQISHFVRPTFPKNWEWVDQHKKPLIRDVDFTIPDSGTKTFYYQDIFSCTYDGETCKALPVFCDHHEMEFSRDRKGKWNLIPACRIANQEPIYDIDESLDRITVTAKPGTMWRFLLLLCVPNEEVPKAVTQ